jgi:hypothetical protein
VADDDVVFSFRVQLTAPATQVVVPLTDANEVLGWTVLNSGASKELRRRLERACRPDADDRVVVISEPMRYELLEVLDETKDGPALSCSGEGSESRRLLADRRRLTCTQRRPHPLALNSQPVHRRPGALRTVADASVSPPELVEMAYLTH